MPALPTYVIVTPAWNEEQFIEKTIQSVISQNLLPLRWIIVSDGSTDRTDAIALSYAANHSWIEVIRMPEHRDRHFAAKVQAFNAGLARVKSLPYDVVVALDADISFDCDYFLFLLSKLAENPKLGLVGTPFAENGATYDFRFASLEHVSGACQVFRRECFENIGGYIPIKGGGIDLTAVLSARMKGWSTRSFPEKLCTHHREQGSASKTGLAAIFVTGRKDYLLGADPVWQLLRAAYRIPQRPYVIGGLALLVGYLWPAVQRKPWTIPANIVSFRRQDQRARLRALIRRLLRLSSAPKASSTSLIIERTAEAVEKK